MKIRCLIVDDEPIARTILAGYIAQLDFLELAGKCANALEALNVLRRQSVDLVFLDVQMPELSGLDFLKTLSNRPRVVLTTAFADYALASYDYGVVDYLLKPIAFSRFLQAVNKALGTVSPVVAGGSTARELTAKFIFLKSDRRIHKIVLTDILYLEGYGNYVRVQTDSQLLVVLEKLSQLEETLRVNTFVRVHKSFIVNIEQITLLDGNTIFIGKKQIPISASYKPNIAVILQRYGIS
ncbi:response regulator transcription factor [Hymenobacter sp. BT664]|uniref:Response regulator transcription factor n=1 Tax=Hymenobacter montanus TaxID=2771359 RepID=A0A927BF86_9BACT|nr:LytTR family DNA-binding domain-containing protein [Hymenobacter montanus]MBD2769790.1 response regulator transcription factor [Hymenobacter montanus]